MKEQINTNTSQKRQAKAWSDAELRRVVRVFELLIQIDQRQNGRKRNEQPLN
jgi:hypothetical protein